MFFPHSRKVHKSFSLLSSPPSHSLFGSYALKSLTPFLFSASQFSSVRLVLSRHLRGFGLFSFRVSPFLPLTSKPSKSRMGKGKGSIHS